jgi:hypothetical protein
VVAQNDTEQSLTEHAASARAGNLASTSWLKAVPRVQRPDAPGAKQQRLLHTNYNRKFEKPHRKYDNGRIFVNGKFAGVQKIGGQSFPLASTTVLVHTRPEDWIVKFWHSYGVQNGKVGYGR